jgi:uncharacterized repeat protein (TIGR01451 family)
MSVVGEAAMPSTCARVGSHLLLAVIVGGPLVAGTLGSAAPATGDSAADDDSMAGVHEGLRRSEYHFRLSPASYRPELGEVFQAPNRAHGLRLYLDEHGLEVLDRTEPDAPTLVRLELMRVGRGPALVELTAGGLRSDDDRVERSRDGLRETYLNTEHGLHLGWEVLDPPEGDGDLTIELGLSAAGVTVHRDRVAIRSSTIDRRLHLGRLEAVDATGATLEARFEAAGGSIHLVIDDTSAVYPVAVKTLLDGLADATLEVDQDYAAFGVSVAGAGDVNGDGYADIIVGAPFFDAGEDNEGAAFVFLGRESGIDTTVHVRIESDQSEAGLGNSVAGAGDVNGDGYSDIVVGAKSFSSGEAREGAAFVFLGSAGGVVGTTLATAHARIESNEASGFLGQSVAGAGDVNGDGYADIIVGSASFGSGGLALVFHGGSSGITGSNPDNADTRIDGDQPGGALGQTVASAGDVNRDGYADIIIGAPEYDAGANDDGAAFVHLGSSSGVSSSFQVRLQIDQDDAFFGWSVAGAGDVNGDGYSDVIVGAQGLEDSYSFEGGAFVFHGGASGIVAAFVTKITGNQIDAALGTSVAGLGDVNGDGYADVAAVAPGFEAGEATEGAAFIFLGSAIGVEADHTGNALAQLETNQAGAGSNLNVAGAGDVDGDGYADVILGAPAFDNGQPNEGIAFVYHGGGLGIAGSDPATADTAIESDQFTAQFGYSVAAAGDVDGDGFADVIVGAPYYDSGEADEGVAFVFLGGDSGIVGTGPGTAHTTIESNQAGANLGISVSGAGDVNGDGWADIIVGAPSFDSGEIDEGAAFVFLGSSTGIVGTGPSTAHAHIESNQAGAEFGASVSGAGDVNGDGYPDIIASTGSLEPGWVLVFHGGPSGITGDDPTTANAQVLMDRSQAWVSAVSGAGDVNGDGFADVVIGSPDYHLFLETGCAFVFHGSILGITGSGPVDADAEVCGTTLELADYGFSVSGAGDVNADGYSDVIVGQPNGVGPNGWFEILGGSAGGIMTGPVLGSTWCDNCTDLGYSVAGAGDINGDGYSDVIVGAFLLGGPVPPAAFVFHGGPLGIPASHTSDADARIDGQSIGFSVSGAGDVNGDGFADIIVGDIDHMEPQRGGAFVFLGGGGPGRPVLTRQLQGNGTDHPVQPWGLTADEDEFRIRMNATHPAGRGHLKLEIEACPPSLAFGDPACVSRISSDWIDAPNGSVEITETVSGLAFDTLYRWRARALYGGLVDPSGVTPPEHPPHGPWRRLDGQANEADIRVYATNADLSLSFTDTPDPVTGLQTLTYTLDVNNSGPDEATEIAVSNTLPTGATYTSATGTDWSCDHTAGVVTCSRSSLAIGAAPPITIEVTAPPTAGMITNEATVTAVELDPDNLNNTDSETTDVIAAPQADLSISKSGLGVLAVRGQSYSYTITASSPVTALGSTVTDVLPADLENVTWTCVATAALCTASGTGDIVDTVDFLAGGVVTYTATGTVSLAAGSTLENTATVAPPAGVWDPNSADNSDSVQTPVTDPAAMIFSDDFESGNVSSWSSSTIP